MEEGGKKQKEESARASRMAHGNVVLQFAESQRGGG